MASKSKVPFALHSTVRLAGSMAVPDGSRVSLSSTGAIALVQRGGMLGGAASIRPSLDANPVWQRDAPDKGWWDSVCWSRDGSRWAAAHERWEGDQRRGGVVVGDAASGKIVREVDLPTGAPITLNQQGKSGALVAFSPDGSTLAWRGTDGEQGLLTLLDVATGRVTSQQLPQGEHDLFAHAFSDDGALYTVSSDIAEQGGTARWSAGATSVDRRWDWAAGCAIVSARRGVWSLGVNGVVWRVGDEHGGAFVAAKERRLARARALRARATHKWDVGFLDHEIARIERDERTFCWETNTDRARWGPAPEALEGARCFDSELLWECGAAARVDDDSIVVTDGVSVLLFRQRDGQLPCEVLLDDVERCSPRVRRIVDVSVAGSSLAVLWKKSASASVLSLFTLDAPQR
ncbi:MAG: hypothetical protein Q8Q09_25995 [Deltaproteobacteria bacterium]|nr:hypothetical protein [Deltaproteobacteria bacterium]